MNKFLKRATTLLMAALCASSFFACGGGGNDNENTPPPADEVVNPSNPEELTGTLKVLLPNDDVEKNLFAELIVGFNETYPNVTVETVSATNTEQALTNAESGDFDIVHVIGEKVTSWAAQGYISSLEEYFEASEIDESLYYASMMDLGKSSVNGEQYMIPRDYSRIICYYNKDIFDALGVEYPTDTESNPWTWERFVATCQEIKEGFANDDNAQNDSYVACQASMSYDILNWAIAQSYGVTSVLDENYLPISSEDAQYEGWNSAFQLCREMTREGYSRKSSYGGILTEFQNKQAAMALTTCVDSATFTGYDVNYDVVPFPAIMDNDTPKTPTGTSGYAIAKTCKSSNYAQAWAFLRFLLSEEGAEIISGNSLVPVMKSVAEDENAAWRSITNGKGEAINTEAFIKYPERDVISDWFGDLPAGAIAEYTVAYKDFLNKVCDNNARLSSALADLKKAIEKIQE